MAPASSTERVDNWLSAAAFAALNFMALALGGILTAPGVASWYPYIAKPAGTPPDWVFGPIWTTLFVMMALSGWLVWRRAGREAASRPAFLLYGIQLALNVAWSGLFFAMRQFGWALAEIVMLWVAIAATAGLFRRHSRAAALLLAPYLLWVGYAIWLNFGVWRLN